MRDMKEGIKKAIDQYEEDEIRKGRRKFTEHEKELIEYGYVQCSLQIGYDIVSKGESFMAGLQEMVLENDKLKELHTGEELIKMIEYDGEPVPQELCTVDRAGGADDFYGCGACFVTEGHLDCSDCVIDKMFKHYAKLTGQYTS